MHGSNVSIAIIVFNMVLGVLFPIVLMLIVKRKPLLQHFNLPKKLVKGE